MPYPKQDEPKDDYIARCVSSEEMVGEFPEEKQRLAVCYSKWDQSEVAKNISSVTKSLLDISLRKTSG